MCYHTRINYKHQWPMTDNNGRIRMPSTKVFEVCQTDFSHLHQSQTWANHLSQPSHIRGAQVHSTIWLLTITSYPSLKYFIFLFCSVVVQYFKLRLQPIMDLPANRCCYCSHSTQTFLPLLVFLLPPLLFLRLLLLAWSLLHQHLCPWCNSLSTWKHSN